MTISRYLKNISLFLLILITTISCKSTLTDEEKDGIREMVDNSNITLKMKEHYERIFLNTYYDMTGNIDHTDRGSKIKITGSINLINYSPSGMNAFGVSGYFSVTGGFSYSISVTNQKNELIPLFNSSIQSQAQYAGSLANMFAQYTAGIRAEENLATQIGREFYYQLISQLRLYKAKCKKIDTTLHLPENKEIEAKSKQKDVYILESDNSINNIDLKNIKPKDYLIYEKYCTLF